MPRSNRPRRGGRPLPRPGGPPGAGRAAPGPRREQHRDGQWWVRAVPGGGGPYRCPGCDHEVAAGVPHVVAWPADALWGEQAGLEQRRHWHSPCWAARHRRPPRP